MKSNTYTMVAYTRNTDDDGHYRPLAILLTMVATLDNTEDDGQYTGEGQY